MAETIADATTNGSLATSHAVARLLAGFFLVHLQAEIAKPDKVLLEVHKDKPVRQMMNSTLR